MTQPFLEGAQRLGWEKEKHSFMGPTTEVRVGKTEEPELEELTLRSAQPPGGPPEAKRWKKPLLLALGAVAVVGLVAGGIYWTRRGVVVVQTGKVARQDLSSIATASGEIKPPSQKYASVNANSFGKIVELLVKEGDHVSKGQLLLRTESVQQDADVLGQEAALKTTQADTEGAEAAVQSASAALRTAQAELQQARANVERAGSDFARAERLLADRLIAAQIYDQRRNESEVAQAGLKAAEARVGQAQAQHQQALFNRDMAHARVAQSRAGLLRVRDLRSKTEYYAPLEGIVTSLPVHEGENVVPGIQNQPGSVLYQISDLSVITAEVKVDETDIVNVKLGLTADVTIDAIPGKTFKGHVTEIGQSAIGRTTGQTGGSSEEAKDFKVVITLDDPPPNLRPGLSTTAKIVTATRQNAIAVPIQALTIRQRREVEEAGANGKEKALAATPSSKEKGEMQGLFVIKNGRGVFRPVETGIMGTTDVEILKGLEPGEEIVTGSYKALRTMKNNAKLKVDNRPAVMGAASSWP